MQLPPASESEKRNKESTGEVPITHANKLAILTPQDEAQLTSLTHDPSNEDMSDTEALESVKPATDAVPPAPSSAHACTRMALSAFCAP